MMEDFEESLKIGFLDEASQLIGDVEGCFLALENDTQDVENLNKIFRLAHNLKGSSRAVGFEDLGHLTHNFESFILRIKEGRLKASARAVSLMLRVIDRVRTMIQGYRENLTQRFDCADLIAELEQFTEQSSENSSPQIAQAVSEKPLAPQTQSLAPQHLSPGPEVVIGRKQSISQAASDETLRVAVSKVEKLLDYMGEVAILQNVIREEIHETGSVLLRKSFSQLQKVSKEVQELAMSLRMVPFKMTFQKMQRIVRDTAQSLGKDVHLNLQGEATEVDKTVLESISDPIVHLVRNAVDHGIESTELRAQSGKASQGQIDLIAYHQAGRLILEVKDDGAGLNPERIRQKAIERGLISSEIELGDQAIFDLIFLPGFSTKEQVSDISGRGVGMDVVKTNITNLGGEVIVRSEPNKGTTFRVSLPLTLAIVDAMVLMAGGQRFVVPLSHVYETLKPSPNMIQKTTNLGDLLLLRGESLPLIRLDQHFSLPVERDIFDLTALVIRSTSEPMAILVDHLVGQQQVVVKQLGLELGGLKGISGVTILGDGKPSLIIEPSELKTMSNFKSGRTRQSGSSNSTLKGAAA